MRFMWQKDADMKIAKKVLGVMKVLGNEIKGLSQQRCPVDSGTLRDSCVVKSDLTLMQVTVGYGGAASSYAARQHEDLSLNHPVGQAKFLETAFNELVPTMHSRIKAKLQASVEDAVME
jgi:hypothetical protein